MKGRILEFNSEFIHIGSNTDAVLTFFFDHLLKLGNFCSILFK